MLPQQNKIWTYVNAHKKTSHEKAVIYMNFIEEQRNVIVLQFKKLYKCIRCVPQMQDKIEIQCHIKAKRRRSTPNTLGQQQSTTSYTPQLENPKNYAATAHNFIFNPRNRALIFNPRNS